MNIATQTLYQEYEKNADTPRVRRRDRGERMSVEQPVDRDVDRDVACHAQDSLREMESRTRRRRDRGFHPRRPNAECRDTHYSSRRRDAELTLDTQRHVALMDAERAHDALYAISHAVALAAQTETRARCAFRSRRSRDRAIARRARSSRTRSTPLDAVCATSPSRSSTPSVRRHAR